MNKVQNAYNKVATSANDGELLANLLSFATLLEVAVLTTHKGKIPASHLRQAQSALGTARNPATVGEGLAGVRLAIKKMMGAGFVDQNGEPYNLDAICAEYEKNKANNQTLAIMRAINATKTLQTAIHELMGGPITEVSIRCDHETTKDRSFNGNKEFIYSIAMGEKLASTISRLPISTALREIPVWLKAASVERDADNKPKLNSDIGMQILPTWMNRVAARVEVLMTSQTTPGGWAPTPPIQQSTPGYTQPQGQAQTANPSAKKRTAKQATAASASHPKGVVKTLSNAYRFGTVFHTLLERLVTAATTVRGTRIQVTMSIAVLFRGTNAKDERRMLARMKVNGQTLGLWNLTILKKEVLFELL